MINPEDDSYVKIIVPLFEEVNGEGVKVGEQEYTLFGESLENDLLTTLEALNAYYEWLDVEGMMGVIKEFINMKHKELMKEMFGMESFND